MDREAILRALRQGAGEYVSGEQLSAALGMTRAAVWETSLFGQYAGRGVLSLFSFL